MMMMMMKVEWKGGRKARVRREREAAHPARSFYVHLARSPAQHTNLRIAPHERR